MPSGYMPITKNEEVKKCIHKIADLVSSDDNYVNGKFARWGY